MKGLLLNLHVEPFSSARELLKGEKIVTTGRETFARDDQKSGVFVEVAHKHASRTHERPQRKERREFRSVGWKLRKSVENATDAKPDIRGWVALKKARLFSIVCEFDFFDSRCFHWREYI